MKTWCGENAIPGQLIGEAGDKNRSCPRKRALRQHKGSSLRGEIIGVNRSEETEERHHICNSDKGGWGEPREPKSSREGDSGQASQLAAFGIGWAMSHVQRNLKGKRFTGAASVLRGKGDGEDSKAHWSTLPRYDLRGGRKETSSNANESPARKCPRGRRAKNNPYRERGRGKANVSVKEK